MLHKTDILKQIVIDTNEEIKEQNKSLSSFNNDTITNELKHNNLNKKLSDCQRCKFKTVSVRYLCTIIIIALVLITYIIYIYSYYY